MEIYQRIARILRVDKDVIKDAVDFLEKKTGVTGVLAAIEAENKKSMEARLSQLGLTELSSAKEVFNALINKIGDDDRLLGDALGNPACSSTMGCSRIIKALDEEIGTVRGFFLKKEVFFSLLEEEPPHKIMAALGYTTVDDLLAHEDWRQVAAALRFLEGIEWINTKLLPRYSRLTPADFEERDVAMVALDEKWREVAKTFIAKKYHNISHLKELGLVFIIPTQINLPGELIRTLALLAHYAHEVPFYSTLFIRAAQNPSEFSKQLISLLRGDVIDQRGADGPERWLVIQRYLAKDDEFDWRLFAPHVNPEAIHWEKAEHIVSLIGKRYGINDLIFWEHLNWVGDYFKTETGVEILVSFNLVDTSMALVMEKEMIKYLYHHQEALWNKIFSAHVGEEKAEELIKENLLKGYIEL